MPEYKVELHERTYFAVVKGHLVVGYVANKKLQERAESLMHLQHQGTVDHAEIIGEIPVTTSAPTLREEKFIEALESEFN